MHTASPTYIELEMDEKIIVITDITAYYDSLQSTVYIFNSFGEEVVLFFIFIKKCSTSIMKQEFTIVFYIVVITYDTTRDPIKVNKIRRSFNNSRDK